MEPHRLAPLLSRAVGTATTGKSNCRQPADLIVVDHKKPDPTRSGLGLGLFIVNEIVAAHHGTIAVTSTQDSGTIFSVRLPRRWFGSQR
jgi:light-regulated signal transduction histidine kinase (bacteriophytochrome)